MEQALMAVCKDIRLGKILIQTNHDTGEPEVCESQTLQLYKYSIKYKIIRNKYFLAGVSVNVLSLKVPQAYITDNSILDLEISHILAVVGMFHFVWRAVSKAR